MKNEKGITLIALVITIIVMLILVTVTIRVATDGNLFTHAANAVKGTKTAIEGENAILNDDLGIEDIVAEQTGETGGGSTTTAYPENGWTKAWTCANGTWSNVITDNSTTLSGDIAAKVYSVTGGYHLVLEKIGSSGTMGGLMTVSFPNSTSHAWQADSGILGQVKKVVIRDGITNIADSAFFNATYLADVELNSDITSIEGRAFMNCTSLQAIVIPGTVETIGDNAFYGCTALTSFTYNGTLAEWGNITKGENWNLNTSITTIHCTNGDVTL